MMYLPKELFRNIDNEKEVLEIISNLELDLKTDKSLTTDEAILKLKNLGEDLIIKELDLMKKNGQKTAIKKWLVQKMHIPFTINF